MAVTNRTYTILSRDSLSSGPWLRVADVPASSNRVFEANDPSSGQNQRVYRLVTPRLPQP